MIGTCEPAKLKVDLVEFETERRGRSSGRNLDRMRVVHRLRSGMRRSNPVMLSLKLSEESSDSRIERKGCSTKVRRESVLRIPYLSYLIKEGRG